MSKFEVTGGDNLWQDLGFDIEESGELEIRAEVLYHLQKAIKNTKLKQKEVAEILGIDQPKVSKIVNGKLSEFTAERLAGFLNKLGYEINISVQRVSRSEPVKEATQRKGRTRKNSAQLAKA